MKHNRAHRLAAAGACDRSASGERYIAERLDQALLHHCRYLEVLAWAPFSFQNNAVAPFVFLRVRLGLDTGRIDLYVAPS